MTAKRQDDSRSDQTNPAENGGMYEIKIKGVLDDHWKQWFEGMELDKVMNGETGQEYMLLTGPIADQPALHGLLAKIRDLNLTLISVRRMNPSDPGNPGKDCDDTKPGFHQEERS